MLNFLKAEVREQKMLSWAAIGLLVFISAFMWAPSRDGLQGVYALAFFLPMLFILPFRKPDFHQYGGWITVSALTYSGFSAFSSLWGEPKDFGFFIMQWFVLAVWLCGSSLLFSFRRWDVEKYLNWLIWLGVLIVTATLIYYYGFVFGSINTEIRLYGFNVFRNANEIGAMCGIVALLAYVKALSSISLKRAWLFYACCAMAFIGLIASFSRGALLAFFVTTFIALISVRPVLKIWLPPLLVVLISFTLFLFFSDTQIDFQGRGAEIGERADVWAEVLNRAHKNIFLGIGMAKDTSIILSDNQSFNHAHNAWLDTFYRTGLIGLTLVLLHSIIVLSKFSRNKIMLPLYLWFAYGCICCLVDSRCFFWEIGAKWFLYWIPTGLIAACIAHEKCFDGKARVKN